MEVTYFYRNPKVGISIGKVFKYLVSEISKSCNIQEYQVPGHRANLVSILKNLKYVYLRRNRSGINHITGDIHYCILALIGCKTVLTIHDLSALDCCSNWFKRVVIGILWFKLPLLIADRVVCISDHTRNELFKITSRRDIEVIYNAVDPALEYRQKPFNEKKPVILQIGTAWNKNLINLIGALSSVSCHLAIVGPVDSSVAEVLLSSGVSFSTKTRLSDFDIIEEYYRSDIISFCSIYEGFGMPIVEGNAVGRCVITSNFSPMNEIGGDSVCYVDPADVASIRKGFNTIISGKEYRAKLISAGLDNIRRFNVADIAGHYIKIYSQLDDVV